MKKLNFTKMSGAGNDFIMIDPHQGLNYKKLAQKACDRTNGIGADGLIIVERSKKSDYKMRIINPDGSEAEMCGNGARCFVAYVVKNNKPRKKRFSVETLAGELLAEANGQTVNVRLSAPADYRPEIPIAINGRTIHVNYIDTGVPHTVVFVDQLKKIDVATIGAAVRYHQAFEPRGTNVNFVEQLAPDLVTIRTYERGVENETKACGTGSVAAAIVTYRKVHPDIINKKCAKMKIRTQGGEILQITFDLKEGTVANVWLKGSAKFIAKGEYYV